MLIFGHFDERKEDMACHLSGWLRFQSYVKQRAITKVKPIEKIEQDANGMDYDFFGGCRKWVSRCNTLSTFDVTYV